MANEKAEDERARLLEAAVQRGVEAALAQHEERQAGGDVKIGWMGFKLEGRGRAVVGVVLSVVVVGAIGVGLYVHDARSEAGMKERSHEHAQLEERLNEVVYVLTLSQQERERLNLAVPDSLRRKQLQRDVRP